MIKKLNHYAIPSSCGCSACEDTSAASSLMPRAWESRYTEITPTAADVLRHDTTGAYTPQGACTDGTYLYRCLVSADEAPTRLQKIELVSGNIILESSAASYGHANDMTYRDGYLYIAHSSSTSTVYKVDAATLKHVETFSVPLTIWGMAYCPENDLFVFGGVGSGYLSVYYPDFKFMYRIKPQNAFYGMVRQGIHADGNYIYIALDNAYGTNLGNEQGSRIMVYTWNGMFIKSIHIPIKEIEWSFFHDGFMYFGTYEGRDANDVKSGYIYKCAFDLYPEQTALTGRPTDVSGGVNNMQRLPEGTPVRLWDGSEKVAGTVIKLDSAAHGVTVGEDGPFRYLRFRFKAANQQVFDWYPTANGVPALRETDITAAVEDTTIRVREMRLTFNEAAQTFTITSSHAEEIFSDKSAGTIVVNKLTDPDADNLIEVNQIWGVI